MMVCEWKTFSTDSETYTLEVFEEAVGDEFEAMYFKENEEIPAYRAKDLWALGMFERRPEELLWNLRP
ncbi:hypothetical protein [Bacillus sp. ISL-75]|uniref:hypothetical protein n=1 Tax=Bacillus sp. ISL-75 TaxID=2819137 RepID=UPI0020359B2E|nr:hypothetical protein [Bacillus sp. ISL-75]